MRLLQVAQTIAERLKTGTAASEFADKYNHECRLRECGAKHCKQMQCIVSMTWESVDHVVSSIMTSSSRDEKSPTT